MNRFRLTCLLLVLALLAASCTAGARTRRRGTGPATTPTVEEPMSTPLPEPETVAPTAQEPVAPPAPAPSEAAIEAQDAEWQKIAQEAVQRHNLQDQQKIAESQNYYRIALAFRDKGDFQSARDNARKAVEIWPSNVEARKLLSEINEILIGGRERFGASSLAQQQIDEYSARLQQATLEITAHIREGERFYNLRQYGDAVTEFENAEFKIRAVPLEVPELAALLPRVQTMLTRARNSRETEGARVEQMKREQALAEAALHEEGEKRQILKKIKNLLDLAYMNFDQKRFDHCIKLCGEILLIDPHYSVALELREDAEKARYRSDYYEFLRRKVDHWKELTATDNEAVIPYADTVRFPSAAEWERISRRIEESVLTAGEETAQEDPEILAIQHKLESTKIQLTFDSATLEEVINTLRDYTGGVNIMIDPELRSANAFDAEKRIPFKVSDISLHHALRYLLSQFGTLDYYVDEYRIIRITSASRAGGVPALELHDIRDLLAQVPDHAGPAVELSGPGAGGTALSSATFTLDEQQPATVNQESIVDLVKTNVAKGTWEGGEFTCELTPTNDQLLVYHTQKVQREVKDFLARLRSYTGTMVGVTARFVAAYDDWLDDIGNDIINRPPAAGFDVPGFGGFGGVGSSIDDASGQVGPGFVSNESARTEFYDLRAQTYHSLNLSDPITNTGLDPMSGRLVNQGGLGLQYQWVGEQALQVVLRGLHKGQKATLVQAPRLTVFNTQRSHIMLLSERAYIADLDPQLSTAAGAYDPIIGIARHGVVLDVRPIVSNDRKYVTMELRPSLAEIQGIRNVDISGAGHVIQLPWLVLQKAETTVVVPDRGTLMISGFKDISYHDMHSGVPILEHIPILNFFFTRKGTHEEKRRLYILVTPEIIDLAEHEDRAF